MSNFVNKRQFRIFSILIASLFAGCAATPPKEPIRLPANSVKPSDPAWIVDARDLELLKTSNVKTSEGTGNRIQDDLVQPPPLQVFNTFFYEFYLDRKEQPKSLPLKLIQLDMAIVKGKASPVPNSPGAEGYAGYAGAALGRLMAQALADSKTPDYVAVVVKLSSGEVQTECRGLSAIAGKELPVAVSNALQYAARSCGNQLMP